MFALPGPPRSFCSSKVVVGVWQWKAEARNGRWGEKVRPAVSLVCLGKCFETEEVTVGEEAWWAVRGGEPTLPPCLDLPPSHLPADVE